MESVKGGRAWESESYEEQSKKIWPGRGQVILAQFSDEYVVVYQMYRKEIAEYAVAEQKFAGCELFNETRMTWIKPNFMWAMFRSRWGSKPNQTNVLAIYLRREAFDRYLELARRNGSVRGVDGTVRLQWDPDHGPTGGKHPYRRAVQLGLRGITSFVDGRDILEIKDISDFVNTMRLNVIDRLRKRKKDAIHDLRVARERVYEPPDLARTNLGLSPAVDGELQDAGGGGGPVILTDQRHDIPTTSASVEVGPAAPAGSDNNAAHDDA